MKELNSDEFTEKLFEVMPKFNQRFRQRVDMLEDIIKLDLGIPHVMAMKVIAKSKTPPIISEIADKLTISYPMMTYIINKLESKKLLKRIRDVKDRRIVRVVLTKKGIEIENKFCAAHKERTKIFLKTLSETDRRAFMKAMDTIFKILEKYSNSEK